MGAILEELYTKFPNFGRLCSHELPQTHAIRLSVLVAGGWPGASAARAQEMEPRSYSPNPVGVTFVIVAFTRSTGGILTDPSLPVDDVEAEVDATALGLGHTFGLLRPLGEHRAGAATHLRALHRNAGWRGRRGLALRHRRHEGQVHDEPHRGARAAARRSSRAASRRRRSARASRFRRRPASTTRDKLINVGTNRWAFKPEIGVSHPVGKWTFEAIAGAWFFQDNDDFFGGRHREQEPLASIQGHVSYTFRPRLWLAFNATYYDGGRSTIDGVEKDDRQSNSRYGLTLSVPVAQRQSLKLNWNDGATTRVRQRLLDLGHRLAVHDPLTQLSVGAPESRGPIPA